MANRISARPTSKPITPKEADEVTGKIMEIMDKYPIQDLPGPQAPLATRASQYGE